MLRFDDVALRRGTRLLIEGASFVVQRGQKLGLTGANGSGKSSLMQTLLGDLSPDLGTIALQPGVVVAHVAQEVPCGAVSAIDFVIDGDAEFRRLESQLGRALEGRSDALLAEVQARFEAIGGYAAPARAARLLDGLGFAPQDHERPVDEFSGGWRMRLNLARALMCRSDLLLLDEPTNHLDLDAAIWLQDWLIRYDGTLMLVSHDREFLDEVVGHVLHIENQRVTLYTGNYSAFERRRAERLAQTEAARERQQREIARVQRFVDRFRAKATKAKQAQSRMKMLARMDVIVGAHVDSPLDFVFAPPRRLPEPLLQIDEAAVSLGGRTILHDVTLGLMPGDRVALLGRNGAGKSTLMKLLAGQLPPDGGARRPAQDLAVGYFAQHSFEQLRSEDSAVVHLMRLDPGAAERDLRGFLGGFGFSGERALDPVGSFSGGEKARLALCLLVYQKPNLLLLDEPTNHLDLDTRLALAQALQEFAGGLVLVSHDRFLLRSVTDEFWLVDGGSVRPFAGDLDDYRQWLAEPRGVSADGDPGPSRRDQRRVDAERRVRLKPYQSAVQRAELDLERLLAERHGIEAGMADPGLYEDAAAADRLRELGRRRATIDAAIDAAEAAWLMASDALEAAQHAEGLVEPRLRAG